MKKYSVIVIDPGSSNNARQQAMLNVFLQVSEIYLLNEGGKIKRRLPSGLWEGVEGDVDFLLCLIHCGDKKLLNLVEAKVIIWYSGEQGDDSRCPEGQDKIWRAIGSAQQAVSIDESTELLDYAVEKANGKKTEKPACLGSPATFILATFAILCQGYLAVHAEYKELDKDWKDQDIAPALEQMSWNSVDKSMIPSSLGKKESTEKIRNPSWWWTVFERDFEDRKSLLAAVKKEWDESSDKEISKELEDLIKLIVAENEVKPPKMVAKAYLALVEKLGV